MSNELTIREPNMTSLMQQAEAVAKSGMFNLKSVNQCLTLMLISEAEGIPAISAVQMYSVINGMPSLKSTEIQARFQRAGGKVNWKETTREKAVVRLDIDGQSYISEFTMDDANIQGLTGKDNWKKMPKQMLMARAISAGVRALYPACLNNMYSVEEMQDVAPQQDVFKFSREEEVEDVEILELHPEESISSLKLKLQAKLKDYSFSSGDIRDFANKLELNTNKELLERLINEPELLKEYIEVFEGDK